MKQIEIFEVIFEIIMIHINTLALKNMDIATKY